MGSVTIKRLLVLIGMVVLAGLVLLTQQVSDEPTPSFSMSQGPGDDLIKPLSVACTADAGYDYCYENTYGAAHAKIQSTDWQGKSGYGDIDGARRKYYIDEVYVNVKYSGDKLYKSGSSTWTSCGSSGCSATGISEGKQILATAPSSTIPGVHFTAWDKFTSTSGKWYYSYVSFGWINDPNNYYNYYVIDCYDDSDVDVGYYCDKSGTWDTWTAKEDLCAGLVYIPEMCVGFDLYSQTCDKATGDLIPGNLMEANSVACGCVIQDTPNTCVDYDLWSQNQEVQCVEGLVLDTIVESNSEECGFLCTTGETKSFACTDGTVIVTQQCLNNMWTDIEAESCPLNWINLEMILRGYIDELKVFFEELK